MFYSQLLRFVFLHVAWQEGIILIAVLVHVVLVCFESHPQSTIVSHVLALCIDSVNL